MFFFNNSNSPKIIKFIQIFTLGLAFIGCCTWFIGEYLSWKGHPQHPALETIGTFSTALGAFIALVIFLNKYY